MESNKYLEDLASFEIDLNDDNIEKDDILSFIIDSGIHEGDAKIRPILIYDTYCIWIEGTKFKNDKKTLKRFCRDFGKHFKKQIKSTPLIGHGRYVFYELSPSSFDLSKKKDKELQEKYSKYNYGRKKSEVKHKEK